jgi:hypothetical protein
MFRNETDLLCSLVNAMNNKNKKQKKSNSSFNDIEKYRDNDGFINLTKVNDINEISRIINLVDKKNYLEELNNNSSLQEKAEEIAKKLKDSFNIDSVKVSISTPEGESFAKIGFDNEDESKCINDENTCTKTCTETPYIKCNDTFDKKQKEEETKVEPTKLDEVVDDGKVVVLHSVGGELFNAPFYNAVLHICENEHFSECGVYAEDDTYPDKVDIHILLPNVWCKILTGAIEHFSELIGKGEKVYVIDPEFFDLHEIVEPEDLWDYSMTITQEQSL